MKDKLVRPETALLAHDKGFNLKCRFSTMVLDVEKAYENRNIISNYKSSSFKKINLPYMSQLKEWIKDNYKIDLEHDSEELIYETLINL